MLIIIKLSQKCVLNLNEETGWLPKNCKNSFDDNRERVDQNAFFFPVTCDLILCLFFIF